MSDIFDSGADTVAGTVNVALKGRPIFYFRVNLILARRTGNSHLES